MTLQEAYSEGGSGAPTGRLRIDGNTSSPRPDPYGDALLTASERSSEEAMARTHIDSCSWKACKRPER
jgi:hypothetical protein